MPALRLTVILASVLAALACNSKGTGKLGVSARGAAGTPTVASVDVGGGISVDRVRVLVQKLELEGEAEAAVPMMTAASHDDGGDDDEGEAEIGPLVVDVSGPALTGKVTHVFDADVPEGVFGELEIRIAPVTGAMAGTPVADMGASSIIVEGTLAGTPFTFATSIIAKQELETRLVVDHAGPSANVTLVLEVKSWFTAADGTPLDPTVDANRAAIEANMLANLRFERDDDEDGVDDDGH
ncbi:MAG TPA: hypothetical protein VIV57_19655 [Anaeromyxobacter sp.]